MWQDALAEQPQLLVAPIPPQLEHHVRAASLAVLLDRLDAIARRPCNRLAAVENVVRDLLLRGEAPTPLHRLRNRRQLLHLDAGELQQRIGRTADVLKLVGEVHGADLARAVAATLAVGLVDG